MNEPFRVIARNEVTWQSRKKKVDQNIHPMRLPRCARNDKQARILRSARNDEQKRIPCCARSEKKKGILLLIRKKEDL